MLPMTLQTPQQIGADIRKYFPHFGSPIDSKRDKFNKSFTMEQRGAEQVAEYAKKSEGGSDLLGDLCTIGSLLTDQATCLAQLVLLETEMAAELIKQLDANPPRKHNPRAFTADKLETAKSTPTAPYALLQKDK